MRGYPYSLHTPKTVYELRISFPTLYATNLSNYFTTSQHEKKRESTVIKSIHHFSQIHISPIYLIRKEVDTRKKRVKANGGKQST